MASKPGYFKGKHFTEWVEAVEDLKREGHLDQAAELLHHLVAATEAESKADGLGVAPWYYKQLAIIARKQGDSGAELLILERYEAQSKAPGAEPAKMAARLQKLRESRMRSRDSQIGSPHSGE